MKRRLMGKDAQGADSESVRDIEAPPEEGTEKEVDFGGHGSNPVEDSFDTKGAASSMLYSLGDSSRHGR